MIIVIFIPIFVGISVVFVVRCGGGGYYYGHGIIIWVASVDLEKYPEDDLELGACVSGRGFDSVRIYR